MMNAEKLTKQAIERYGENLAVACSFGKDSMVVLDMARKVNPNVKVVFNNTGVEFPETIKFKNRMAQKWKLNLIETRPYKKSFWDCLKEYGLPTQRNKCPPKCCYYCKERPMQIATKEYKIIAYLTGLMAEESWNRKNLIRMCGQRYYVKDENVWKYHPIAYWKEADVWDYIKANQIPINPVYTKWNGIYKRCGCLPCTSYLDWENRLSKSHPKLYRMLKEIQHPTQRTVGEFNPYQEDIIIAKPQLIPSELTLDSSSRALRGV
jgi:phosphoadenosine phosphosulfate reductase